MDQQTLTNLLLVFRGVRRLHARAGHEAARPPAGRGGGAGGRLATGERSLNEVMRPRGDVTVMRTDLRVAEAVETARTAPYSRFPVIGDEELVGDIRDEYDEPGEEVAAERSADVDAGLTIEDFAERTGVALEDGPYETAAGHVIHRLGRLAERGDAVGVDGHRIEVTAVDRHRITRVLVRPAETTAPRDEPG